MVNVRLLRRRDKRYNRPFQLQGNVPRTIGILRDAVGSPLTSPANHVTLKMQRTGPTIYSPYPRRQKKCLKCAEAF